MASVRVDQVLGEIAALSEEEQGELLTRLPRVLHRVGDAAPLSPEVVHQAIEMRERIRRRLAAAGQSAGSIDADLEEVREGRLADLTGEDTAQDQPQ